MYDVAGIYTLSAQPGTMINANYIDSAYKAPYAHLPSHWFYIYTDEGSSYMTVKDNWTPSEKFLQNANGPGNTWQNNGPQVHDSIRRNAGLEPRFNALLKEKNIINKQVGIVHEQPNIVEIIVDNKSSFTHAQLKQVLQESNSGTASIYKWENRYVVFGKVQDVSVLAGKIANRFTGVEVKAYHDLFYEFNRRLCADTATAIAWEHVILTANLVADVKLQDEYLDYHAQQSEKWPEVSKGFCNASFQQLLIYRNGRQLMLLISIPKGKTLDELNLKTTENNPKVEAWNKLMKKYQEGIAGTRPGEVWVELKKID
jgi:L-rhamnose mutarotase